MEKPKVNPVVKLCTTAAVLGLVACAANVPVLKSGPVANLSVKVSNFADNRSILNNENVWVTLEAKDRGWEGVYVLKNDEPSKDFVIPASTNVNLALKLMQGGGGFSSSCGAQFDLTPPKDAKLNAEFTFYRGKEGPEITGCNINLYSNSKLINTFTGGSNITHYVVKVLP
jgi:hypothetical protein